jgi:hypothetical protein
VLPVSLSLVAWSDSVAEDRWRGVARVEQSATRTRPSRRLPAWLTLLRCSSLLFCIDLSVTHRLLDSGELRCPRYDCDGRLGPWGSARPRTIRLSTATHAQYTPRRARCRACERTQVLASASTLPRRPHPATNLLVLRSFNGEAEHLHGSGSPSRKAITRTGAAGA